MIVFDLHCGQSKHVFEAWFGSTDAYENQRQRGLIACPFCGDTQVDKAIMAPRIGAKSNQSGDAASSIVATNEPSTASAIQSAMSALAEAQAEALKTSTWVGSDFVSKARSMDAGETPHEPIHGQATVEQAKALIDDGISILPLPFPVIPPNQRN